MTEETDRKTEDNNLTERGTTTFGVDGSFSSEMRFMVTDGRVDGTPTSRVRTVLLSGVTRTELRLFEARYFLQLLAAHMHNEALCLYHLDAFLAALRSVTLVLQKEASHSNGFTDWYAAQQLRMKNDPVLTLLRVLRNKALKQGLEAPRVTQKTVLRYHLDGRALANVEVSAVLINDSLLDRPIEQFESACAVLSEIVAEGKAAGVLPMGPQRPVTSQIEFLRETKEGVWEHFDPPIRTAQSGP